MISIYIYIYTNHGIYYSALCQCTILLQKQNVLLIDIEIP